MNKPSTDMPPDKALACASEIEKLMLMKGIWYQITRVVNGDLAFIKIEASIKVKAT